MEKSGFENKFTKAFDIDISRTSKMRVLIIDDDSSLADFLRQFLEEMNFRVEIASSGEEGISILIDGGAVDIALVDFRLPGMDGLETIKKITEISPDTVTIVVTGLPTLDSSIRAIRLGASDYLLKPFNLNDVSAALKRAVKEREIKTEIKKLREKASAIERKEFSSQKIDVRENIKGTGKIHVADDDDNLSRHDAGRD